MHGKRWRIAYQGVRRQGPADATAEEPAREGVGGQMNENIDGYERSMQYIMIFQRYFGRGLVGIAF